MTPGSSRPVAYFPQYLSPLASAAVAAAEAADLGEGPVPFTLTPAAAAAIEDMEMGGFVTPLHDVAASVRRCRRPTGHHRPARSRARAPAAADKRQRHRGDGSWQQGWC